jgi:hypothetical protein
MAKKTKHPALDPMVDYTDHWTERGKYYGYPVCCIKSFLTTFEITEAQESVHEGHGFLPCPECSQKILEGKATLESLITNRLCPTPFPEDAMDKILPS